LLPDIKLGTGAWLKPYGFVKTAVTYDSSSPSGIDFPLPYLNGDAGPNLDPAFHIRARSMRLGGQFEWTDPSPNWVLTGRVEAEAVGKGGKVKFTPEFAAVLTGIRASDRYFD
jgi:hypothetical protein